MNSISSNYVLRTIFSYLDYERLLKIVKYNKALQAKLDLGKDNYDTLLSYEYCSRKSTLRVKHMDETELNQIINYIFIASFILFAYIILLATIFYYIGSFNKENLIPNFDPNILNIIHKINISLFLLDIILFISYFIISRYIIRTFYYDVKRNISIKRIILVIINLSYIYYEIQIIRKIYLSYKIKNNNFVLLMAFDYILLILLLLYIILMIVSTTKYFLYAGTGIAIYDQVILKKYKNIQIKDFELPKTFLKMNKMEKVKFLRQNENQFQHSFNQKNIDLMKKISEYRLKNNSRSCYHEDDEKIPYYILHGLSEEKLFNFKNIFKLPNRSYLFKYKKNILGNKLNEDNNDDIKDILDENINKLSVTEIGEYEYIFLSDDIDALFAPISLEEIEKAHLDKINKEIYDFNVEDLPHED